MPEVTKRVLLTGATGFIGANLARRLIGDGHDVHLLVRPVESRWRIDSIARHVRLHEVALEQQERVEQIVTAVDPEWVFHLAAYGSYSSQRDVQSIVATNYNGTVNLLEACLKTGFEAFVNAGSSSEYGHMAHAPSESELPEPNSHYAATKAAATLTVGSSPSRRADGLRPCVSIRSSALGKTQLDCCQLSLSVVCVANSPRSCRPRLPVTMCMLTMPSTPSSRPQTPPWMTRGPFSTSGQVSRPR